MYWPIKNGTTELIYGEYNCHIPPVPERHEILFHEYAQDDQYWRRILVSDSLKEKFREEFAKRIEEFDEVNRGIRKKVNYIDTACERHRRREFHRRKYGVWFFNNGVPTYITGHHYFYLHYCKWDHKRNDGYPIYYEFSRRAFYFRQYSEEEPTCLGTIIIGPRGTGKSNEELACLTNNMTIKHNATAVLQSKNFEKDAKGVLFKSKLVPLFNALPDYFKPQYSHGSNPENGFDFHRTSVKGKSASSIEYGDDFELNSYIFPVLPGNMTLDSDTAAEIFCDEIGKTDPTIADVHERHQVNMRVVYRNHEKVGFERNTSTVEKMKEGGAQCHKLWIESDSKKRDKNGQTVSKLNRLFISALDTDTSKEACNKFGFVDRRIANEKIENKLSLIRHDYIQLSSEMRKSPRNEAEAFIQDQSNSIFNIEFLTNRLNQIRNEMKKPPYVRGDLYWLKEKFGPVGFVPNEHSGRFNWAWFPDEYRKHNDNPNEWKILNNVASEWGYDVNGIPKQLLFPRNDHLFRIGGDPVKLVKTKDPRASKASLHGFRMFDFNTDYGKPKNSWESHNFIFEYINRPDDPEQSCEDAAMACIFLGCKLLPERNVTTFNNYFERNGLERFLFYPNQHVQSGLLIDIQSNSDEAGYATSAEVIQAYTTLLIQFINEHIKRMPFDNTIEDWMNFDPNEPTKSDPTVSSGYTLVHANKTLPKEDEVEDELANWFDTADNSGVTGQWMQESA